jgi:protein-export membrane protein SecD
MKRSNNIILLVIIILFALSVWAIVPNSALSKAMGREGMQLGLDLKGGIQLVYEVQVADNATATDLANSIDSTILKIEQRINKFGVTEPVVQKVGTNRIMIQLPGYTDIEAAKSLVEQTGFLEFREVERDSAGTLIYLKDYTSANLTDFIQSSETGSRIFVGGQDDKGYAYPVAFLTKDAGGLHFTDADGNPIDSSNLSTYGETPSWVISRGDDGTPLTGDLLSDAQAVYSSSTSNIPEVSIEWNDTGAEIFDQIALRLYDPLGDQGSYNYKYVLGIFLDNTLISAPKMNASSFQGKGVISGSFTATEAEELATLLKSGSLPMPLGNAISQEKVSASLGAEFVNKSILAGVIGLALVMIFMIAYYRIPGLTSSLALIFYGTLTLAIFKLWPVTMSLGGIGGFVVSLGIAVDANVLIFERMKEEFRMGRTLGASIEAGFHRAWSAIWDSNVTTFIACIILFWLGNAAMHNSAVIGFAVTLFIGAIVSMFTAVLVTRTLLRAIAGTGLAKKPGLFTVTGGKK